MPPSPVPALPGTDLITLSLPVSAVISWKTRRDVTGAHGGGAAKAEGRAAATTASEVGGGGGRGS